MLTQSHVFSRFPPLSTRQQQCKRHESFRKFQKKTYRDQQNVCSRQNCQSRVTFDTPKPDARTTFNKEGEKHGQREILESRDIRQVPNKRRVEVQSQSRDSLMRDVCTCLACHQNFSSIFDHPGRDTLMSFVFHTHDLTNILRKRLILQQSVERH